MAILQTLQHKASLGRLRKASKVSADAARPTVVPPLPTAPADTDRGTEILSPELPTTSPNPNGFKFWRKRAPSPSPSPEASYVPALQKTKSILRRRPSRSASDDEHETARVKFGNRSPRPGYHAPPSAFRAESASPTPPLPIPSPSLSAGSVRDRASPSLSAHTPSPGRRTSSLPSPALTVGSANSASSTGSYFPLGTPNSHSLSPQAYVPSTPIQARSGSVSSRGSTTPRDSTPSPVGGSRLSTAYAAVPESPADAACRPYTPVARGAPPPVTYRATRPTSSVSTSSQSTVRAAPQSQSRPVSSMSSTSSRARRVSSRPQMRSTRSTRASIASISTFASSSSTGHSSSPGMSPVSNNGHFATVSGHPSYAYASSVASHGYSPVYSGPQAFTFPSNGRSSVTPTPTTPPKHTSSLPPGAADDVPMFNVIPATPGAAEEDAVADQPTHRRSTSSERQRRRSASMERTLEVMHEEEEEVEEAVTARKLDFDLDEFKQSPRLNDGLLVGSPIHLNTVSLEELDLSDTESDTGTDETEVRTEDETVAVRNLSVALQPVPAPPPRFPKSPKRHMASLYQAHDDGRSISQSLAELAALACDLPPLDEDMTMMANTAARRLAEARATVDVSEPVFDYSSPRPVSAAPVMMTNYRPPVKKASSTSPPTRVLPQVPSEDAELRRKTIAAPPQVPLPPTPKSYSSQASLPSLMSHASMPSSSSDCTASSWNSQRSITSSPESDKLDLAFDHMMIGSELPDNPGLGLGLGLGLDLNETKPAISVSPADDGDVRVRPNSNRMSSWHPHRVALYGTPELGRIGERDSYCSVSTVRHTPHGSISSISLMSEMSDDEALNAQVVDITTLAHPYVVGRRDARAHEVGVAF
ncbi:hypothetical protein CcaverHIS002_0606570 [Cutaneotrichosporon cavernicola]|uniref:Uncharacterized protein n=1 Tax=Cutaneotrichosporon cavernicola TaxID=279322 RepID=A0AA48QY56_9TREE|nr:uncharacterized protein CcaverHIS019_0606010 [Cutaneotrichosporon cavernicola]BEI86370.1 hypothetical protein CcaverHIS002_0606570 [Cutaneotrichosporon cavernicola]BEI94142.1 hypothetical protein CcaverHIS019_0606010 [Cutaneotrichosporon cavernicola]BEJ01922.1 hypothetical protein CcaverHIS631_0606040 [Cutaneotrichosporon cavernicola]BEJ09686.1 hypothetical protein CcaverHIS641_0606010 [Cutaneotrichosporon cavernicola]